MAEKSCSAGGDAVSTRTLRLHRVGVSMAVASWHTTLTLTVSAAHGAAAAVSNYHIVLDAARQMLSPAEPSLYSADGRKLLSDDILWNLPAETSQEHPVDVYAMRVGQLWVWPCLLYTSPSPRDS